MYKVQLIRVARAFLFKYPFLRACKSRIETRHYTMYMPLSVAFGLVVVLSCCWHFHFTTTTWSFPHLDPARPWCVTQVHIRTERFHARHPSKRSRAAAKDRPFDGNLDSLHVSLHLHESRLISMIVAIDWALIFGVKGAYTSKRKPMPTVVIFCVSSFLVCLLRELLGLGIRVKFQPRCCLCCWFFNFRRYKSDGHAPPFSVQSTNIAGYSKFVG